MHQAWDPIAPLGLPLGSVLVDAFDLLGLFSVFSTPWFLLLMTVLTISIVCCTLDRTPRLWRGSSATSASSSRRPSSIPSRGQRAVIELQPRGRRPDGTPLTPGTPRCRHAFRARHFRRQRVAEAEERHLRLRRPQPVPEAGHAAHARRPRALPGGRGGDRGRRASRPSSSWARARRRPVRPIGTPGNLLVKVHDFAAPQRADGSFADFSTDLSVYRTARRWRARRSGSTTRCASMATPSTRTPSARPPS